VMRDIKFRVWDKGEGVMISPDYITRDGVAHWTCHSIPQGSRELQQFTGLRDKNGKEIYEGDIILYRGDMAQIKYHGWGFHTCPIPDDNDYRFCTWEKFWLQDVPESEVIGNIYENPELLKGE
jgi:uncharacterized phage protein (TIGR01671 family)